MKKRLNTKAKLFGLALLAAGATVTIPAVIPAQAQAAEVTATTETVTETEKKTVTRTVRFYFKDDKGNTTPVKSSNGGDFVRTASATFERTVIKDKKTGKVLSAPAWGTTELAGFDSPVINGYTPDVKTIPAVTVSPEKLPKDLTVYYTENPEHKKTLSTESKTVTRKITYYRINDDGSTSQTWSKNQSATFTRSVTTDGNGKKEYGAWAQHTFNAEDVASMEGYTPDIKTIPAVTFTPDNPPSDVKVYFKKNAGSPTGTSGDKNVKAGISVIFTDGFGKVLKEQLVADGENAIAPAAPTREGYTFAGWDKSFSNIKEATFVAAKWVKNATQTLTEKKSVERKIFYFYDDGRKVIDTNGQHAIARQFAEFIRYNIKDAVTGKITYGQWKPVTWDKMKVMDVAGYLPNISEIPAITFTPDNVPVDIKIYYSKKTGVVAKVVKMDGGVWKIFRNGKIDTSYTGLDQAANGVWYYFKNGVQDKTYTGIARSTNGNLYYAKNGVWDTTYTGLAPYTDGKWYYVKAGRHMSYTGIAKSTNGKLYYAQNGVWNTSYTGLAQYTDGKWYYVKDGRHVSYTGIAKSTNGKLYYAHNGVWDTSYTGLAQYTDGKWYFVKDGRQMPYTGIAKSTNGKLYYAQNGVWDTSYTGLAQYTDGKWYYVRDGRHMQFTGVTKSTNGKMYYAKNGVWDTTFTGTARDATGSAYNVKDGRAI